MPLRVNQDNSSGQDDIRRRPSIMRRDGLNHRRSRTPSRLTPRWLLPHDTVNLSDDDINDDVAIESDEDSCEATQRIRLRFAESNNYRIVPRTDHLMDNEEGTFGSHCRHEHELSLPEKINTEGLINSLDDILLKRRRFIEKRPKIERNMFKSTHISNRGIKRKFNSKPNIHLNTNNIEDIMKSIYLKPGSSFKMKSAHPNFMPIIKFDNVSRKLNEIQGRISVNGCNVSLNFEGKVVDLIHEDFRILDATKKKNPLIEASIFSNLLRNALCYDHNLKNFIGRHAVLNEKSVNWKPFFMDKVGYLKSNELMISGLKKDTIQHLMLMTPRLTQSEYSESEMSVWDDKMLDDDEIPIVEEKTLKTLNTPTRAISTSPHHQQETENSHYQIPNFPVKALTPPKFPSTSLFYHHNDSTAVSHLHSKILSNWFLLPPFVDFLQTPSPPTPPKSTHSDICAGLKSKGGMNPENVLICEKCLIGDDLYDKECGEMEEQTNNLCDSGLLGKYIFIKTSIDIEDILWEDIYEMEDEGKKEEVKTRKDTKAKHVKFNFPTNKIKYKCMRELKIKSDLIFKRRRRLSRIGKEILINPFSRHNHEWPPSDSSYMIDPLLHGASRSLPSEQIITTDSEWDEEPTGEFDIDDDSGNPHAYNSGINGVESRSTRHNVYSNFLLDTDSFSEGDESRLFNDEQMGDEFGSSTSSSSSDSQLNFPNWEHVGRQRRSSSVSSGPNLIVSELLYNFGRGGSITQRNCLIYARSLYKNDLTTISHHNNPGYRREVELRRKRPRDCRKNLNHCIFNDDENKFNKLLTAEERKLEYDHHLKLYLFMVIDRATGELHYIPANLDSNNWSIEQNNGELFRDVETFKQLWSVLNSGVAHEGDGLKSMKDYINENVQYRGLEKLMLLHGLTNGSIVNGLSDIHNKSKRKSGNDLFSEINSPNIIDTDRVVGLTPENDCMPYSIQLA